MRPAHSAFVLFILALSLAACENGDIPVAGDFGSGGVTVPPPPPPPPVAQPLVIPLEGFNDWFNADQCSNPLDAPNLAACTPVMGPSNSRQLVVRSFANACETDTVNSWIGGRSDFHRSPLDNPPFVTAQNWLPIRFHQAGKNQALMSRYKQGLTMGYAQVHFLNEGTAPPMIDLFVNGRFTSLPGCANTYNETTARAYHLIYHVNPSGAGPGFAVFHEGLAAGSFIPHTLEQRWYQMRMARTAAGYEVTVKKFDGGWQLVGQVTIPVSNMLVGGAELPPGYVGVNTEAGPSTSLVGFDQFEMNW